MTRYAPRIFKKNSLIPLNRSLPGRLIDLPSPDSSETFASNLFSLADLRCICCFFNLLFSAFFSRVRDSLSISIIVFNLLSIAFNFSTSPPIFPSLLLGGISIVKGDDVTFGLYIFVEGIRVSISDSYDT